MTNYHVHGWLRDVPGYRENYQNQRLCDGSKQFISSQNQRPLSLASVSSVDSVNLDDLINANFTTNMDDETALASLELDDSSEDFWKLDNVFSNCIPSPLTTAEKPRLSTNNSDRSQYESEQDSLYNNANKHSFVGPLDLDTPTNYDLKLSNMHLYSPSSPLNRTDRFGSFSSEMSSNSQSAIAAAQLQNIYPSASTSTSSVSSHSTAKTSHSSFISRPPTTKSESSKTSSRMTYPRKPSLVLSISENTAVDTKLALSSTIRLTSRSASHIGLVRRASHIPTPSSRVNSQLPLSTTIVTTTLQRTKSTSSNNNNRASHIPSPNVKRNPTSLIHSSVFSPKAQTQQKYPQPSHDYSRPKTSMGTLQASHTPNSRSYLRTPTTISSSKPSSLRAPSSRM